MLSPRRAVATAALPLLSLTLAGACGRPPAATAGSAELARGPVGSFAQLCPGAIADSIASADTTIDTQRDRGSGTRLVYVSRNVYPTYPLELRATGVQGKVVASFVIDTLGRVVPKSALIRQSTDPQFSLSVCRTIPRMRYAPIRFDGRARRVQLTIPFEFALGR